eukprot:CAMPEP_0202458294 /NCGR_PEP_ID=MMETSP1360-20130828/24288_1 /ASSEMBLY_ACC=CAM_ASM_000848 /TAXON_ID=515479 /ORGANISM="Licmophora paradoxa, Strain CCMP2313" /LENGTH=774 /DNA_ID=CAMNT_0049078775 /DNA_START=145 /DNA_END=2469 /DNA_ORIENTATION=+
MDQKEKFRRRVRHSVVSELPDDNIAALYPVTDNYIQEPNGRRSPKSLQELCVDALCRSLPNLEGDLPPGLPQDVVDHVVKSLINHSALNATTLRILRNCEIGSLSLAGCRGVTDEWLEPFSCVSTQSDTTSSSPQFSYFSSSPPDPMERIDLGPVHPMSPPKSLKQHDSAHEDASCSTGSFISASSVPFESGSFDQDMIDPLSTPKSSASLLVQDFVMHGPDTLHLDPTPVPLVTSSLTLLDLRGSQGLTDRGLLKLSKLNCLEVAKLDGCHSLTGRGLLALSSSHRLHTLSLANCRRLTDEAIINISDLISIEALVLDGCRCLTDRSLCAISNLVDLRKLDMSQCDLITNEGVDHIHGLEMLQELSFGWCRCISDEGIDALTLQPGRSTTLRILRLARCPLSDVGVESLGRLAALEELDLNGCSDINGVVLGNTLGRLHQLRTLDVSYCPGILRTSWQGKINNLRTLELSYSGVRDAHLSRFSSLPALEELTLDSCPMGDWAIAHLADNSVAPNLISLDLADTDLTDMGMIHLKKLRNLSRLSLFYCNITNAGLRHISHLTKLEVLNLDSREISDSGLAHLRTLKNLKSLDIFSGRITDSGCSHLARIKSLETLELCGGGVGDVGCTLLATLDNLTSLNLSQNERITNRGAAALGALSNLKSLNLSNTRVSSEALKYLGGLVNLQSLALYGCRGIADSDGPLVSLQNGLPSLKCLRLNNTPEDDGIVAGNNMTDPNEDSDSDINVVLQYGSSSSEDESNEGEMDEESVYSDHD